MGRFIPNENTWIGFTLVEVGAIGTPSATAAAGTTGGTLAAGTYAYQVVAKNENGHSAPSAEVTATVTGSTGEVTLTVTPSAGETMGYDVYGRNAGGGKLKIGSIDHGSTTFTDDGTATPRGKMPTTVSGQDLESPTLADVNSCVDLTDYTMSFNASATGNAVPTPSFAKLFETSINGTSQATFTADFYRDDEDDVAWDILPRGTKGAFIISRYGGKPGVGDVCEVWPVGVLSRAMANMANNTTTSFTVTCSVPKEPGEDAIVVS